MSRRGPDSVLLPNPARAAQRISAPLRPNSSRTADWFGWGFVVVLLLAQWGLFRQFAQREVVWAYPQYFDQLAYLEESYQTYERILDHGLVSGLEEGMGLKFGHLPMNAAGATLHLQAALLYLMAGPSRLSALSLNFIYFALFQLILVGTVRWLTGRWSAAALALGLLLSTLTGFFFAGGLFDFRLDFIAFCLFGIFICLVVRSGIFADRRWSIATGVGGTVLGTFRFITLTYLLGAYLLFFGFLIFQWFWRWKDFPGQQAVQRRIKGLMISGLTIALIAGPVLWHHREAIAGYYWAGHVKGPEKGLRAAEAGTTTLRKALEFYPVWLARDHAGPLFIKLSALLLLMGVVAAFVRALSKRTDDSARPAPIDFSAAIPFVFLCLLVPLVVLTSDESKAPQVAGIMVGPLLWLVVLLAVLLFGAYRDRSMHPLARRGLAGVGLLALMAGIWMQFNQYTRQTPMSQDRPEVEKLIGMYDRMAGECRALGWTSPQIATDCNADFLYHKNLTILAYERHDVLLSAGSSLERLEAFAPSEMPELYERLARSDFVLVTRRTAPAKTYQFPFELQMEKLHPQLLDWCRKNMIELQHFQVFDRDIDVFIRPAVSMQAAADGWVTSRGMTVTGLGDVLRRWPRIEMRGEANFQYMGRVPHVTAQLLLPGGVKKPVAAEMEASGTHYVITLRPNPADVPATGAVRIHVDFDAHFVPKQIGANDDTRELVMPLPSEARVVRQTN